MIRKLLGIFALCTAMLWTGALAETCSLCGGDRVCDTCAGKGYMEVTAYGSAESVKIACLAGCEDGFCPDCLIPCDICGSDGLCNTCAGTGYMAATLFESNEEVRINCFGEMCQNGKCTACGQLLVYDFRGVYDVTGFYPMQVAIDVGEDGEILSFEVVKHEETPGFGASLIDEGFDYLIGQDIASAQIDAKAGVTFTVNALNDALKAAAKECHSDSGEPTDAVIYEVNGFLPMQVAIDVGEDGEILSFEVVKHEETPGFGASLIDEGFDYLIGQDIASAQIDAKAGVTWTHKGLSEALKKAAEDFEAKDTASGGLVPYKLTPTPTPTSTPTPTPTPKRSAGQFDGMTVYEAGQYKVGTDMRAGEYVVLATGSSGYFSVTSDANGRDILFNENFETNSIMEVKTGEYVKLNRCRAVRADDFYAKYSINRDNYGTMLKVGYDIMPGEYKLETQSGKSGYYCIYDNARHDDIIANDNFSSSCYINLKYGQYVILSRCRIDQ